MKRKHNHPRAARQSFPKQAKNLEPANVDRLLKTAVAHHRAGQLSQAETIYRELLQAFPCHAEALHLLAVITCQAGKHANGLELLEKAILLKPDFAEAYSNRGIALQRLGQSKAALESFDKAILLKPDLADAHKNRGYVLNENQQYQPAVASFEEAIILRPDMAEAHNGCGIALENLQQYEAALASFNKAIVLRPDYAEAYFNRGNVLQRGQNYQAAIENFDRVILFKPDYAQAHFNRGIAFHGLGHYEAAVGSFDQAILLEPDCAEAHGNRGLTLYGMQQYQAALESFDKTFLLKPNYEYLLGTQIRTKQLVCNWEDIEGQCRDLETRIDRNEKVAEPFTVLGITCSPAIQRKAAEIYGRDKFPSRSTAIPPRPRRDRIRIGYFSTDYYNHATCHLIAELLERHDRRRFEILGFSFGPDIKDEMSARVSAAMDRFIDVRSMSDQAVAQLSRQLGVDIAVDLKGFTKDCRPGIFAQRAAPVQVNYLGFPATTGAPYIDYLIADHTLIPEASQRHYSEKIVYLPDSYQVNDSRRLISTRPYTRAQEGLPEQGFVYCSFNSTFKITPAIFDLWMRILGRVAGSVLWLLEGNAWAVDNLRQEAGRRCVSPQRLIFAKRLPPPEHLARHSLADLFLDTFPCNAHTTASDALWAGLPVLTRTGATFASRVAASLLGAIDLPELITTTEKTYEALAVELASDPGRHQEIRKKLQRTRLNTPLFDVPGFTRNLEAAYSAMYERCQAELLPDHIHIAQDRRASQQVPGGSTSRTDERIERFAVVLVSPPGYIHIEALNEIAATVHYGLLALGHDSILTTKIDEPDRRSIFLGAHLLKKGDAISVKPDSILYNFEQMDPGSTWIDNTYLALLAQYQVWDYSERNIAWLKQRGVHNIRYVPIGWMPQLTQIEPAVQDIDILFYGSMNERRARILNDLESRNLRVERVFGIYGKERDALIARSRIVLNLHYYESKIFEIARVSYLLGNSVCVVSEDGLDPIEDQFAGALRFAPYDELVGTCLQLLSDPEARMCLGACGREKMQSRHEDQYLKDALAFGNDAQEGSRVTVNALNNDIRTPSGIPTILNIGSGKDWKEEALNLDIQAEWTPDVVFDLNHPLPPDGVKLTSARFGEIILKEDHFEFIHAYDVLEHLSQLWTAMTTCLAWLKVGGVFRINVPYDLSLGAWQDPTHVRAFNENSWLYYTDWFWYLGWDRWRFDRVSLQYMLSSLGAQLKEQGSSDADLIRTPRAVDSMLVELRKRPLTDAELIELNTRRPYRRNAGTPRSG